MLLGCWCKPDRHILFPFSEMYIVIQFGHYSLSLCLIKVSFYNHTYFWIFAQPVVNGIMQS